MIIIINIILIYFNLNEKGRSDEALWSQICPS